MCSDFYYLNFSKDFIPPLWGQNTEEPWPWWVTTRSLEWWIEQLPRGRGAMGFWPCTTVLDRMWAAQETYVVKFWGVEHQAGGTIEVWRQVNTRASKEGVSSIWISTWARNPVNPLDVCQTSNDWVLVHVNSRDQTGHISHKDRIGMFYSSVPSFSHQIPAYVLCTTYKTYLNTTVSAPLLSKL